MSASILHLYFAPKKALGFQSSVFSAKFLDAARTSTTYYPHLFSANFHILSTAA